MLHMGGEHIPLPLPPPLAALQLDVTPFFKILCTGLLSMTVSCVDDGEECLEARNLL